MHSDLSSLNVSTFLLNLFLADQAIIKSVKFSREDGVKPQITKCGRNREEWNNGTFMTAMVCPIRRDVEVYLVSSCMPYT